MIFRLKQGRVVCLLSDYSCSGAEVGWMSSSCDVVCRRDKAVSWPLLPTLASFPCHRRLGDDGPCNSRRLVGLLAGIPRASKVGHV